MGSVGAAPGDLDTTTSPPATTVALSTTTRLPTAQDDPELRPGGTAVREATLRYRRGLARLARARECPALAGDACRGAVADLEVATALQPQEAGFRDALARAQAAAAARVATAAEAEPGGEREQEVTEDDTNDTGSDADADTCDDDDGGDGGGDVLAETN